MSEPTPIGKRPHRVTSFSVKQYLDKIHSARTAARSLRVERTLAPQRLILSSTSNRGSTTLEEADDRIAAFIDTRRAISEEVMRPALARQRFRSYRAKAQAQMNVFAVPDRGLLADNTMGVGIMLFFGDAVFKSGGGPTKTLFRRAVTTLVARVIKATERCTTKCCAACGCVMQLVFTTNPTKFELHRAQRADRAELNRHAAAAAAAGAAGAIAARAPPSSAAALLHTFTRETHDIRRCCNPDCPERHLNLRSRDPDAARSIEEGQMSLLRFGALPDYMRMPRFVGAPKPWQPPPFMLTG
jgi:hypothetical protein